VQGEELIAGDGKHAVWHKTREAQEGKTGNQKQKQWFASRGGVRRGNSSRQSRPHKGNDEDRLGHKTIKTWEDTKKRVDHQKTRQQATT